jgi:hypothetical protein
MTWIRKTIMSIKNLKREIIRLREAGRVPSGADLRPEDRFNIKHNNSVEMAGEAALQEADKLSVERKIPYEILMDALKQSLDLQSHYASLLNQYDGGRRRGFKTAKQWVDRLIRLGKFEESNRGI